MEVFIISFVVIVVAVLGMAVGVIFGRPCIKGSCGGLGTLKKAIGIDCSACPNSTPHPPPSSPRGED